MTSLNRSARLGFSAALAWVSVSIAAPAPAPAPGLIADIDLSKPFATRSPWRLTASQGPSIEDPVGMTGDQAPGEVSLCLRRGASGPCDDQVRAKLGTDPVELYAKPHFLNGARIVRQGSGRPVLLVQTASLHGGDGDQLVLTQALAYRPAADRFERVYAHTTGRNNNQEVRYVEAGPLKGDIISADPTETAPYGFWIVVSAATDDGAYRQVLRYRSATRYGDGNPLAVIDSEMPNIEKRLGLWRPGAPLPLPAKGCAKPHLIREALWCE